MKISLTMLALFIPTLLAAQSQLNQICAEDSNEWGFPSACSCEENLSYNPKTGQCLSPYFESVRQYKMPLFETQKICEDLQEQSGTRFNCNQVINFAPSGRVRILLTDIINMGSYTIDPFTNNITIVFNEDSESSQNIVLTLSPNRRALVNPKTFDVWEWNKSTL